MSWESREYEKSLPEYREPERRDVDLCEHHGVPFPCQDCYDEDEAELEQIKHTEEFKQYQRDKGRV